MATFETTAEIRDDFLTCTFCRLPFKQPKALPCLHTFCKDCLSVHILKHSIAANDGTFCVLCPICKQICDLPPDGIDGLPDNVLMRSILAMINTKAKQICDPCTDDGQKKFANFCCTVCEDFMCEPCAITHKRTRGTKEHLVLDVGCMKELCRIVNQDDPHRPIINVRLIRKFGKEGFELRHPEAVTVNMADDIVVAQGNSTVSLFTANGEKKKSVDQKPFLPENAISKGVAITSEGYLAVLTHAELRTTNNAGQTIIIGAKVCTVQSFAGREIATCVVKTKTPEDIEPHGIAITSANHIIISDIGKHCIYVFDAEYKMIKSFGKRGSRGAKQFKSPFYVATNQDKDIIVSDYGNHCIKVFQLSNLNCKLTIGCNGSNPGQFMHPMGVCADKFGNIFVADRDNHRIQMFDPKGQFLANILQETYDRGDDIRPLDIAMTSNSNLVVLLTGVEGVDFSQVCIYQLRSTKIPLEQHRLQQEKFRKEATKKREAEEKRMRDEEEKRRMAENGGERRENGTKPQQNNKEVEMKQESSSEEKTSQDEENKDAKPKRRNSSKKRKPATEANGHPTSTMARKPAVLPPIRGGPTPSTSDAVPSKHIVQPDAVLKSIAESIIFDPDKCEATSEAETKKAAPTNGTHHQTNGQGSRRSSASSDKKKDPSQVCTIL